MRILLLGLLLLPSCVSVRSSAPAEKSAAARGWGVDIRPNEGLVAHLDAEKAVGLPGEPPPDRLVIKTGDLIVRTGNPEEVGARAVALVEASGGHVTRRENSTYAFRVPAGRFDEVFEQLAGLGAVSHRRVDATDVTEEVHDLELRLRNARALRDRYEELLKKAEKVEDMLAIEKELGKALETIERLEGQLQARMTEVKMSRISLRLDPAPGSPVTAARSPFPWIREVGVESLPVYRRECASSSRIDWDLPAGFADMGRVRDTSIIAWAYAPDGVRVVVRRFEHEPEADAAFWDAELLRDLVKARGYEPALAPEGSRLLLFRTLADGRATTYALRVAVGERYLNATEVIGPADALGARWPALLPLLDQIERETR
jgi:hypothetical protein